jgi:hypothetical protein
VAHGETSSPAAPGYALAGELLQQNDDTRQRYWSNLKSINYD